MYKAKEGVYQQVHLCVWSLKTLSLTSKCLSMILHRRKSGWKKCTTDLGAFLKSASDDSTSGQRISREFKERLEKTNEVFSSKTFSTLISEYWPYPVSCRRCAASILRERSKKECQLEEKLDGKSSGKRTEPWVPSFVSLWTHLVRNRYLVRLPTLLVARRHRPNDLIQVEVSNELMKMFYTRRDSWARYFRFESRVNNSRRFGRHLEARLRCWKRGKWSVEGKASAIPRFAS